MTKKHRGEGLQPKNVWKSLCKTSRNGKNHPTNLPEKSSVSPIWIMIPIKLENWSFGGKFWPHIWNLQPKLRGFTEKNVKGTMQNLQIWWKSPNWLTFLWAFWIMKNGFTMKANFLSADQVSDFHPNECLSLVLCCVPCWLPAFQKWTFRKGLYRENDWPSI